MIRRPALLALSSVAVGALAVGPATTAPFLPVPPAAFLNYPAASGRELSQEAALDPLVLSRLARHFHCSRRAMAAYIASRLVRTRLTRATRYRVGCLTPLGREYSVTERLPAGTPVFADSQTGRPVLKLACGNPLTAFLPGAASGQTGGVRHLTHLQEKLGREHARLPLGAPAAHPHQTRPHQSAGRHPAGLAVAARTPVLPVPIPEALVTPPPAVPQVWASLPDQEIGPLTRVGGIQQTLSAGRAFNVLPIVAAGGAVALLQGGGPHSASSVTVTPAPFGPSPAGPFPPAGPVSADPALPDPASGAALVPEAKGSALLLAGLAGLALFGWLLTRWTRRRAT